MKALLTIIVMLVAGLAYAESEDEQIFLDRPDLKEKYDAVKRARAEFDTLAKSHTLKAGYTLENDPKRVAAQHYETLNSEFHKLMAPERERIRNELAKKAEADQRKQKIAALEAKIEEYRKAYPPNPFMVTKYETALAKYIGEGLKPADVVDERDGIVGTWVFIRDNIERFKTVNYYADHTCKQGTLKGKWEIKTGWVATTWEDSKGETHGLKLPIVDDNRGCQFNAQGEVVYRFRMVRVSKMADASQESVQKTIQSLKDADTKAIQAQKSKAENDKWK